MRSFSTAGFGWGAERRGSDFRRSARIAFKHVSMSVMVVL
jgi:hypothetical protein